MNNRGSSGWVILAIIVIGVLGYLYLTDRITFSNVKVNLGIIEGEIHAQSDITYINFTPATPPIELQPPKIESLRTEQQIYQVGDIANASFDIRNELGLPFNISTRWILNKTIPRGISWSNESSVKYNTSVIQKGWYVWQTLNDAGEWELQVILRYFLNNKSVTQDYTTPFRVITND